MNRPQAMLRKLSVALLALGAVLCLAAGLRYLLRTEFMPYHAEVVGAQWAQLDPRVQAIVLGMLKIIGGSFLSFGAVLIWMLAPAMRGERWVGPAVLTSGLLLWVPTQYVTVYLKSVAPAASTPVLPTALVLGVLIAGSVLNFLGRARGSEALR